MSFGKKNLRFKFAKGYVIPIYLDRNITPVLQDLIKVYEECVNKPFYKLDKESIRYLVGDDKLTNSLIHTMSLFYKEKPPINIKLIRRRRIYVFKLVNEMYHGFVPSEKRKEFLHLLRKMGIENVDELWSDEPQERKLHRIRKCIPEDIIKAYNYEVINTIFVNSTKAIIVYEKGPFSLGAFAKIVLYRAKKYGLIYDVRLKARKLEITIEGPVAFFGRPTSYGRRISQLVWDVLSFLRRCEKWQIWALLHRGYGRSLRVLVLSNKILPDLNAIESNPIQIYDSYLEERIATSFKSLGFKVIREPEPLILGNTVFIPDFLISKDNLNAYVEIAGYWRKEYAIRKANKIMQAIKMGIPLIVLAEEKLRKYLPKDEKSIIYYSLEGGKPSIPYGKVLSIFKLIAKP